ncbi:hypothetical protein VCUG_01633 [Vavraia culicis subsp. floridensis]|uniref:PSP proline-rich domain-containing protein n=1 Tax=Vavraia culicis (isolate floridensis) TaxID=948595 RepID=L2GTC0_VAVCU|nr:uncharacterized protein VCUG_01633 [Vavraia culicis subsp. floridensis]ELA46859.1 hypothetical protein VCUG_01633 [Vavraia culicis subsp. floridensis]
MRTAVYDGKAIQSAILDVEGNEESYALPYIMLKENYESARNTEQNLLTPIISWQTTCWWYMAKKIKKDSFYLNDHAQKDVENAKLGCETVGKSGGVCQPGRSDANYTAVKTQEWQNGDAIGDSHVEDLNIVVKGDVSNMLLDKCGGVKTVELYRADCRQNLELSPVSPSRSPSKRQKNVKLNRKRRKHLLLQSKLEELKLIVDNPATVHIEDVSARNPILLNKYKNIRNAVPVPPHWKAKKTTFYTHEKYEPPFVNDGALRMRAAFYEHTEKMTEKQRESEKKYPKMTDEFLLPHETMKNMLKSAYVSSRLLRAGILYDLHEGMKIPRSDNLLENISTELRKAYGMKKHSPPPWLHNMQRIGPPPDTAYKIPGVNCEIPKNSKYGYDEDGWGKLPTDMNGKQKYVYDADSPFSDVYFSDKLTDHDERNETGCEIKVGNELREDVKRRKIDNSHDAHI